jgi:hypothetical protein
MKPRPKAAPMKPMPFARSAREVMSLTAAVATERLPLAMPATMRDRRKNRTNR